MRQVTPDFSPFDRSIDIARVVMSPIAMLSLYVDPSADGLFHLGKWLFATLLCHLLYSVLAYLVSGSRVGLKAVRGITTGLDLTFATAIAYLTEGGTSPSFVFFLFTIVAVGFRAGFRATLLLTLSSVALYLAVIALSSRLGSVYAMRAVYLAIAGYLIGFFGLQRANFETHLRRLEGEAEREAIARSLHDGYIQALAGIRLRLESCRDMLASGQPDEALAEIKEIQVGVIREYDKVREYLRTLASAAPQVGGPALLKMNMQVRVHAVFTAAETLVEHILQVILEGTRNAQRHGHADSVAINVRQAADMICITIDDDGVGFGDSALSPWTITSRVAELGGKLAIRSDGQGAHLDIAIPNA